MTKRINRIYLVFALMLAVSLSSILLHRLRRQKDLTQSNIESDLPAGDYLPDAEQSRIRVLLKTNGFTQMTHPKVEISSDSGMIISYIVKNGETNQEEEITHTEGNLLVLPDDERFQFGSIKVRSKEAKEQLTIHSLVRGYGIPSYRGFLELYTTPEGIVIVNELLVEEYLAAVVPSEMPASYEAEALKCQAVCARSYAYCQMQIFGYPQYHAHVDDSVSYQVYGNSKECERTTQALEETRGEKLYLKEEVVKTYYYSTSCGYSTSVEAWGSPVSEAHSYLCGVNICDEGGYFYEENLPWYRWRAVIKEQMLSNLIELNTGTEIGTLQEICITKQGVGGVALQIVARGTKGEVTVNTENKIRAALGGSGYEITRQDGKIVKSTKLLPSAFFTIAKSEGNYIIEGGGYGHGIGMSQNGANEMAKTGMTYQEILQFFYPGTEVK